MSRRTPCAIALILAGCNLRPYDDVTGASGATGTTATTGTTAASGATNTVDPSTGAATTAEPTTGDAARPDLPCTDICCDPWTQHCPGCDVWTQDCPEGQKCVPYSGDGDGAYESRTCVDVAPNPAGLYEPCTAGPASTGEDTCDNGLICWYVGADTGEGICIGLCTGSPGAPGCASPDASCVVSGSLVFTPCLPRCDPLQPTCPGDGICKPNPTDFRAFVCTLAGSDAGQLFDACEHPYACGPGLVCTSTSLAAECDPMAWGCCDPLCDVTQPNTCPGAGQECLPWYEPGEAPPEYEHVGFCAVPMP